MQDAIAHFESTGEIQEILLPGFDQRGRWTYSFSVEGVEEALFEKLAGTKLDPVRLTNTNVSGETTLLCSFVDESEVAVAIPYHHVKGEIVIHNAGTFDAPMLLSVGERMVSICAMEFRIPKLQSVGGGIGGSIRRQIQCAQPAIGGRVAMRPSSRRIPRAQAAIRWGRLGCRRCKEIPYSSAASRGKGIRRWIGPQF